jgi:microcompartment protein CcmK/EutM
MRRSAVMVRRVPIKAILTAVGVTSLIAGRLLVGPDGPKLSPDLRRPAEATEVRLPMSMWRSDTAQGHQQFDYIRRTNYNSVGPEDDWSEVIDASGKVWQVHGGERQAIGTVELERIDLSGDGIDEWVLSTGAEATRKFAVLQTTEPVEDLAVIAGAGEFRWEDGMAEMLEGRWVPPTNKRGLLSFTPETPELQCFDLRDC